MRLSLLAAIMLAAFLPIAAADPLAAARNASINGPLYTFDLVYETPAVTATGHVDPTKPKGERLTVITPPRADWPEDFEENLAELDRQTSGDIWCADLFKHIPTRVQKVSEDGETATYTFKPMPRPGADGPRKKLYAKLVATAVVSKDNPALLTYRMHLPEPTKPHFLAKVNSFSMVTQCERAPDGRTYKSDMTVQFTGTAVGQPFSDRMRQKISSLMLPESS